MHAILQLFTQYPWLSAVLLWIFATVIHTMPAPLPTERWYGWFYQVVQAVGANWVKFGQKGL